MGKRGAGEVRATLPEPASYGNELTTTRASGAVATWPVGKDGATTSDNTTTLTIGSIPSYLSDLFVHGFDDREARAARDRGQLGEVA